MNPRNGTRRSLKTSVWLCLVAVLAAPLHAQNSQGTILGHVTDPSGAVLAGASVTITNLATSVKATIKTGSGGDYVFVNVIPGNYNIVVAAASGFKTAEAHNVRLDVEATLRQDFQLEVGTVQESTTVSSDAQMVQSDNVTSGEVIPGKLIDDLPIKGRDFTNLLRMQAGATEAQGTSTLYWAQHGLNNDFTSVSVNGTRAESVSYLVDGVSDNDQYFSTANNIPSSGSIEEFKVQNGLYSAEYGQGSAQVNVAIKTGTNQFHGTLYDYVQNDIFAPQNPLNAYNNAIYGTALPPKNQLVQNQYGFTFGGPILIPKLYNGRNKTFFFFSYEAGRQRTSTLGKAFVPTAQERTGDFSDWKDQNGNLVPLYDPTTETGGNPATRTAFPNNQILSSELSPIAKNYMALLPQPNVGGFNMAACAQSNVVGGSSGSGSCANYVASLSNPYDTDNDTFRVDENLGEKDRLYVTGILGEQKDHNPSVMPLTGELKYQKNYLYAVSWEHTITPSVINSFRLGYNWMKWRNGSDVKPGVNYSQQLGFGNFATNPSLYGVPNVVYSGFQPIGDTNNGWTQKENNYEAVENLKWIHGKHTVAMGADIRRYMLNMIAAFGSTGIVNFNGAYSGTNPSTSSSGLYASNGGGSAIADFLLGNPSSITGPALGGSDRFDVRATNWNFFVQDDFHVTPRVTLNLGLRYEIPPAYHDINNSGPQLNMANGGGFIWANRAEASFIQQQPGVVQNIIQCCTDNKLVPTDHKDLAPRIGIAFRPFNTDRFVVRAGYGIFYDLQNQWYQLTTYDNFSVYTQISPPYSPGSGSASAASPKLDELWSPFSSNLFFFQDRFSSSHGSFVLPFADWPQINWPGNRSPYNEQWTLDTQYALKPSLLLDIGYVGSHSLRQPGYWYYNAGTMPAVDNPTCNGYFTPQEAILDGDGTGTGASGKCVDASGTAINGYVPVQQRVRFPNIDSSAYAVANLFSGNYNSLQVRLNQRLSHGLLYQLNYTWSRTLDNVSAINNLPTGTLTLQNNNCFSCDYGPASFDQTHRFVGSGSYDFPFGKGRKWSLGPANWLLGGWNFSGIYTVASGQPETLFSSAASSGNGLGEDGVRTDIRRPNQVGDPNAPVFGALDPTVYQQANFKSNVFHWFNPAAYAAPAGNQYGDASRGSIRQPYFMRGDITLSKTFPITERQNFQYRLEIFNVFSLWHSAVLNGGPNGGGGLQGNQHSSNFGSLVSYNFDASGNNLLPEALQSGLRQLWNPRIIQMTAKYTF